MPKQDAHRRALRRLRHNRRHDAPDAIEGRSIAEGGPQYFQPTGGFRTIAYFLGQAIQPDEENYAIARAFGNHGAMLAEDDRVLRTTAEVNAFYKSEVDAGLRSRRPPIPADERTVRYFMPFEESGEVEFRMRAHVPEYLPTECLRPTSSGIASRPPRSRSETPPTARNGLSVKGNLTCRLKQQHDRIGD